MDVQQVVVGGHSRYPDVVVGMLFREIQINQGANLSSPVPTYGNGQRRGQEFDTISISVEQAVELAREILKLVGEV